MSELKTVLRFRVWYRGRLRGSNNQLKKIGYTCGSSWDLFQCLIKMRGRYHVTSIKAFPTPQARSYMMPLATLEGHWDTPSKRIEDVVDSYRTWNLKTPILRFQKDWLRDPEKLEMLAVHCFDMAREMEQAGLVRGRVIHSK